jgi:hypothetical protein
MIKTRIVTKHTTIDFITLLTINHPTKNSVKPKA